MQIFRSFQINIIACLFLCFINLITFWHVQRCGFVYDDAIYVTQNTHVTSGFTTPSILWAFTATDGGSYHPLTWLSWMGDYELYGLHAGGYHWTNLLIHIGTTLLLFLFLQRATGKVYRGLFVAALFAIHPLHVESVAWIAERKDTLSTFLWMLTMWAYLAYTEHPDLRRYLLVVLFFILGLMAKPMLVTLPFVLLLLDYWPLKRIQSSYAEGFSKVLKLLWEKIPLILLSMIFSMVTLFTQKKVGALMPLETLSLTSRVMNSLVSYALYIEKMFWPQGLSVFYPYRKLFIPEILLSALLLIVVSLFAAIYSRKRPYLTMGWLWYLGTLVPVIGLVQVGMQSMADRYTYVSLIGLFIMITWYVADHFEKRPYGKTLLTACALSVMVLLSFTSWVQVSYWQNSITLFANALRIAPNNHLAHSNLGVALKEQGKYDEAMEHFQEAVRIRPNYAIAHDNIGSTYILQGRVDEGIKHLREAFRLDPHHLRIRRNLADALMTKNEFNEAIELYRALRFLEPDNAELLNNLGVALAGRGQINAALECFDQALRIKPEYVQARVNRGVVEKSAVHHRR